MTPDAAQQRIAQLEAQLAERDAQLAERDARIAELEAKLAAALARIVELEAKVAELEAKLAQNSSNSSMPPSSDKPWNKPKLRPRIPSGKKRGGQKGHKGHGRQLVPPEDVRHTYDVHPEQCHRCGSTRLFDDGSEPVRHQVTDIPMVEHFTDEWRLHLGLCLDCGAATRAELPAGVPRSNFGPVLVAFVALLSGAYRVSKRGVQNLLKDLWGVAMSLGAVRTCERQISAAIAAPVEEAHQFVQDQAVANADETTWLEKAKKLWLWVATTASVTVYFILPERSSECARKVLGRFAGILGSDRYKGYLFYPMDRRQVCWAHLRRLFLAMSQRDGPSAEIGSELIRLTDEMFHRWHQLQRDIITRRRFRGLMVPLRFQILRQLHAGMAQDAELAGTFGDILKHEDALFTFVRVEGVEPTNNAAEIAVRDPVLLRRVSFGTQSEGGSRYVERMLTVKATLRKQGRPLLGFLVDAVRAKLNHSAPPSLLPSQALHKPN